MTTEALPSKLYPEQSGGRRRCSYAGQLKSASLVLCQLVECCALRSRKPVARYILVVSQNKVMQARP